MTLSLQAEAMVIPGAPHPAYLSIPGGDRAAPPEPAARRAFEGMARAHNDALLAFAIRLTGNPSDARDLVQDTLERALRRAESFAPGTNARAWLFSILHNAFIDRCRRRKTEARSESIDEMEVAAHEPEEPPRWTSISAEQLSAAVAALGDEFRVVYELHARDGLSYQAIAERLGIPPNTVGTRLARARRKLRTLLEDGGAR
jgi:RNA polymerase sigma-70 factor (ECF subfamily)